MITKFLGPDFFYSLKFVFQHFTPGKVEASGSEHPIGTECEIYYISGTDCDEKQVLVSSGWAQLSKKDHFNRRIGRRISLGRALVKLPLECAPSRPEKRKELFKRILKEKNW